MHKQPLWVWSTFSNKPWNACIFEKVSRTEFSFPLSSWNPPSCSFISCRIFIPHATMLFYMRRYIYSLDVVGKLQFSKIHEADSAWIVFDVKNSIPFEVCFGFVNKLFRSNQVEIILFLFWDAMNIMEIRC